MKDIQLVAGVTKQALYKHNKKQGERSLLVSSVFESVDRIREEHPMMGCRSIYDIIKPISLGRDKLESLLLNNGYRVRYKPNYVRTTYSVKAYYPNLIEGIELTDVNQLWQTDITYFFLNGKFYYLTFIIDVYSRRIVGYAVSRTLHAEANIKALKMAFRLRKGADLSKLIHHSDRGGQYIDKEYLKLLKARAIKISMGKEAWQNPYAERINGVIKNMYLKGWVIKDFEHLGKQVKRAVNNYNGEKPHGNLPKRVAPLTMENNLLFCDATTKPRLRLYAEANSKNGGKIDSPPFLPQLQPREKTLSKADLNEVIN
jgi:putative transposase